MSDWNDCLGRVSALVSPAYKAGEAPGPDDYATHLQLAVGDVVAAFRSHGIEAVSERRDFTGVAGATVRLTNAAGGALASWPNMRLPSVIWEQVAGGGDWLAMEMVRALPDVTIVPTTERRRYWRWFNDGIEIPPATGTTSLRIEAESSLGDFVAPEQTLPLLGIKDLVVLRAASLALQLVAPGAAAEHRRNFDERLFQEMNARIHQKQLRPMRGHRSRWRGRRGR